MIEYIQVTQADVDELAKKLNEFGERLTEKETTILLGVLSLAEKSIDMQKVSNPTAGEPGKAKKKKLVLERETIRNLNVWERLLATQGHSLWTCNGMPALGDEVINPVRK